MSATKPIKNQENIQKLKDYFLGKERYRDYTMVTFGLNTALRISDLLSLTWGDVYHFDKDCFYTYICVKEQKTGKSNQIYLNDSVLQALSLLMVHTPDVTKSSYIFPSRKKGLFPSFNFSSSIINSDFNAVGFRDINCKDYFSHK